MLQAHRNIVICCDGTDNQFGPQYTNIMRLVRSLACAPGTNQLVYYDPGVGTLPEPSAMTWLGRKWSTIRCLAFGTDVQRKVEAAYTFLMDFWEPGDHVFLFGFSRGAYTVRVLAGLLHALGLIPRGSYNLVPYLLRLLRKMRTDHPSVVDTNVDTTSAFWQECIDFRRTLSRTVAEAQGLQVFPIHFLGAWDTVSSVGWMWNPTTFPFTRTNASVRALRHAVALDERRAFFRYNGFGKVPNQDRKEIWFPGVHADVGGGYAEEDGDLGLWRLPFGWMVEQAKEAGLRINESSFQAALRGTKQPSVREWADAQHHSLTMKWWPAEFLVKKHGLRGYRMNFFRRRTVPTGAVLHSSVLRRIREPQLGYAPSNLSEPFVSLVRELTDIQVEQGHPYWPDGKPPAEGASGSRPTSELGQGQSV